MFECAGVSVRPHVAMLYLLNIKQKQNLKSRLANTSHSSRFSFAFCVAIASKKQKQWMNPHILTVKHNSGGLMIWGCFTAKGF